MEGEVTADVIGSIRSACTDGDGRLIGHISLALGKVEFRLVQIHPSNNPNSPSHRIIAPGLCGNSVQIGSAWTKTMKRHGREGEQFLTLTFDSPPLPKPLNVAAFRRHATGEWQICFRERQGARISSGKRSHPQRKHRADTVSNTAANTVPTQQRHSPGNNGTCRK